MKHYTYVIQDENDNYYGDDWYPTKAKACKDAEKLSKKHKVALWVINYDEFCEVAGPYEP